MREKQRDSRSPVAKELSTHVHLGRPIKGSGEKGGREGRKEGAIDFSGKALLIA